MKKSAGKPNSFLMEMLLVLLFFAISAAIVLQLFASAYRKGRESTVKNEAMLYAQTVLEQIHVKNDPVAFLTTEKGFAAEKGHYTLLLDEDWRPCGEEDCRYRVTIDATLTPTEAGQMFSGTLQIQEENLICELPLAVYLPGKEAAV